MNKLTLDNFDAEVSSFAKQKDTYIKVGLSTCGIAAGADGLIVEVHPNPEEALSDGGQSLKPERFSELVTQVKTISEAIGRTLADQPAIPDNV